MGKGKSKFKKGDSFFHNEQKVFVVVDDINFYQGKGFLYTLNVFSNENDKGRPWKRYYEDRVINELTPLKGSNAVKVLYGN